MVTDYNGYRNGNDLAASFPDVDDIKVAGTTGIYSTVCCLVMVVPFVLAMSGSAPRTPQG